eukprot:3463652-Amphidinium_carterae.1
MQPVQQSRGTQVIDPSTVPEVLCNLTPEICAILSPLEIDVGPSIYAKNKGGYATGYRQHCTMIRFRWKEQSVTSSIKKMKVADGRDLATLAYKFLYEKEDNSYAEFVDEQKKFVEKHPKADERKRRRRLEFIERVGIECALWPQLFWATEMTI